MWRSCVGGNQIVVVRSMRLVSEGLILKDLMFCGCVSEGSKVDSSV